MNDAKRMKREKLREQQCKEKYARSCYSTIVERNEFNDTERMCERVLYVVADSAKEACGYVKVCSENPKNK